MQRRKLRGAPRGGACVDARLLARVYASEADTDSRGRSARRGSVEHAQSVEHWAPRGRGKRARKRRARGSDSPGKSGGGSDRRAATAIDRRSSECGRLRGRRAKYSRGPQGPRGSRCYGVSRWELRAGVRIGGSMALVVMVLGFSGVLVSTLLDLPNIMRRTLGVVFAAALLCSGFVALVGWFTVSGASSCWL